VVRSALNPRRKLPFVESGAIGERGQSFTGQVVVGTFTTSHGQHQRAQRSGHLRPVTVDPVCIGGSESQAGDPSRGADEEVGLLPAIGQGYQRRFAASMHKSQGSSDVFAVDNYLAQHRHDGAGG
jgi:hypothetical protein